jgi:hypothetical protein
MRYELIKYSPKSLLRIHFPFLVYFAGFAGFTGGIGGGFLSTGGNESPTM